MSAIELVPAGPKDTENLFLWRQDPDAQKFLIHRDKEIIRKRLEDSGSDLSDQRYQEYSWIVKAGGTDVGVMILKSVNWERGHGEVGFLFDPKARGKGYGTASARLFIDKIFEESALTELHAFTHAENIGSQKLLERLGFTRMEISGCQKPDPQCQRAYVLKRG